MSTEYGKLGRGKARTGGEQIFSMIVWKDLSCSSSSLKFSGISLRINLLSGVRFL